MDFGADSGKALQDLYAERQRLEQIITTLQVTLASGRALGRAERIPIEVT
jgi:hypothetical protein